MHSVEGLGLRLAQVAHLRGDNFQARLLKTLQDSADMVGGDGIGLDDGQGALNSHGIRSISSKTLAAAAFIGDIRVMKAEGVG